MKQPPKWITGLLATVLTAAVTTVVSVVLPTSDLEKIAKDQAATIALLSEMIAESNK